ncbi:M20 family metallopeptidase [Caproicibacter sp.]|uniref:M20 family metallopeptidase n=1 Tax=Caproicibacter sp. TaxID=2814884 RepID=UPI00398935FE
MTETESILASIDEKSVRYLDAADRIWELAETRFQETKSAALLCEILKREGFQVETGVAGMDTAFLATYGGGKPVIALLGEYDALSSLSQEPCIAEKKPLIQGANGHGCGHNALGVASLAAAIALKDYLKETGGPGTVRYYGCPAEEGGGGKVFMARDHLFDGLDAAITWHPGDLNRVMASSTLANIETYFVFSGTSSHAASDPHLGRSALDAVELMDVGVNFLREHVMEDARMHYAVTDSGGVSPNVVQAKAEVLYLLRAPTISQVREIYDRVCDIAKGAALMTETQVEIVPDGGTADLVPNDTLGKVMQEVMEELGGPVFSEEDQAFAREIEKTLTPEQKAAGLGRFDQKTAERLKSCALAEFVVPYHPTEKAMPFSTDVGDVSWNVPTVQLTAATQALGTPGHSWQIVSQGKSGISHTGMLYAGKVMALTGLRLFQNPELCERAKEELKERRNGEPYDCLIPEGFQPHASR